MFVVKKQFRNYGEILQAGSIIKDPAIIKRFKTRLKDREIIEVDEHNLEEYKEYFLVRFGVDISKVEQLVAKPVEAKPVEVKPVEVKPVETKPVETKKVKPAVVVAKAK